MAERELERLARKGERKFKGKLLVMLDSFTKSKKRAIENYWKLPFSKARKIAYALAWEWMPDHYAGAMTEDKAEKWKDEWIRKMSI